MPNDVFKDRSLPANIKPTGLEVNVSAPGKVILHGEHSVVYGKLALAASLGLRTKLKLVEISAPNLVYVELPPVGFSYSYDLLKFKEYLLDDLPLTENSSKFNWEHPELVHHESLLDRAENFLSYTTGTISINSSQQMALKSLFYLLASILGSVNVDVTSFAFFSHTDLNIGAGSGSSASFLVSIAALLVQYVKLKRGNNCGNISKEGYKPCSWDGNSRTFDRREQAMICKWAFCAEKIIHGTPSGIDNTICTYGSMVEFRKGLAPKLLEITCDFKIMLINTNIPRETKKLVSKVARLHERYPDLTNNILNAMEDVAFIALHHISSLCAPAGKEGSQIVKHYEELGRLASINHNLLSSLGVSHLKLDEAIYVLTQNGLQGKLTGAGGGGYATCLIPPYVEAVVVENVIQILSSRGFQVVVANLGGVGVTVD